MLKNSAGRKDAVLTMSVFAMAVVLLKTLLAGVTFTITGDAIFHFGTIDSGIIGALLTPTLSAYVARRYTDSKFKPMVGDNPVDSNNKGANNANSGQP